MNTRTDPPTPEHAIDHADPVRVGCVSYLNTSPLIEGLDKARGVELVPAPPARLIDLLLSGRVEVALLSLVDAQRSPEPVALIPCGMIGCDGPTMTVRLYSATPIGEVARVFVDSESHTSVALLRILLKAMHGIEPEFIEFNARERMAQRESLEPAEWPDAMLLIGDKVVTDSPPAIRYPHQLDLGDAWKALTGLPFVYAVWACLERDASSARVRAAAIALDRQRRHNATRLDWLISTRAPERGWPIDLAQTYLHDLLRYEVGPREREAVERFFAMAQGVGALGGVRRLRWLDEALAARAQGAPCPV